MIRIVVAGALGKMAARIITLASLDKTFKTVGVFESEDHPAVGTPLSGSLLIERLGLTVQAGIEKVIDKGDVVIDFTHPSAVPAHLRTCVAHRKALVIGTTGLGEKMLRQIRLAAKRIPIVQSPNMSAGVNLLFGLSEMVASKLNASYDIEITETHHRHKKDAPSGTALELARRLAKGRGISLDKAAVYGRKGLIGERIKGNIGIHAIRGGDVVGEHSVAFLADGERVELVHKATSRDAFAKGALLAAKFTAKKKKGLFNMQDVLGL